ncbi:MAG: lipoprotein [Gammaproteobacteria bacterium]|nr:lipoprotein [Gammaproteobacteria bacterium]NNF48732.1 lipoprotein [Woeseiaceae bacterium]MBT8094577.1 lipoprotein [Gammaproteobacteria bacterium]MBT8106342.1 lipoprotein [Gammaproteobacteria bacterium]NNK26357.1 lipoprotein [Woeseiaceae bacterium]
MRRFLTALFAILFVTACGQSGPLYIPGNPSRMEEPPPAAEEETEEKAEEDRDADKR